MSGHHGFEERDRSSGPEDRRPARPRNPPCSPTRCPPQPVCPAYWTAARGGQPGRGPAHAGPGCAQHAGRPGRAGSGTVGWCRSVLRQCRGIRDLGDRIGRPRDIRAGNPRRRPGEARNRRAAARTRAHVHAARFGTEFGDVRVHTGAAPAGTNAALGGDAFTYDTNIYFGEGREPANDALTERAVPCGPAAARRRVAVRQAHPAKSDRQLPRHTGSVRGRHADPGGCCEDPPDAQRAGRLHALHPQPGCAELEHDRDGKSCARRI